MFENDVKMDQNSAEGSENNYMMDGTANIKVIGVGGARE